MRRPGHARRAERGVALVAVLWGVLLLALLAASFSSRAGTDARLARNFADRAEARSLADAGVFWAVRELLRPAAAQRIAADGTPYAIEFRGVQLRVEVQDEGGRIDLNGAPAELLAGLFAGVGADPAAAAEIGAAIVDWRDADDLRRLGGAERRDYLAAGLAHGPRNDQFRVLDELRGVLGMTPELYAAAAPALTVQSRSGGIDPMVAPASALLALPGMSRDRARQIAEMRGSGHTDAATADAWSAEAGALLVRSSGKVHTVRVTVETASGTRYVRAAVVELTGRPHSPYRFLLWAGG